MVYFVEPLYIVQKCTQLMRVWYLSFVIYLQFSYYFKKVKFLLILTCDIHKQVYWIIKCHFIACRIYEQHSKPQWQQNVFVWIGLTAGKVLNYMLLTFKLQMEGGPLLLKSIQIWWKQIKQKSNDVENNWSQTEFQLYFCYWVFTLGKKFSLKNSSHICKLRLKKWRILLN